MLHFAPLYPYLTVDTRTLIKPPLFQAGICAYTNQILVAGVEIISDIIYVAGITALFSTQIKTVYPYASIPKDAIQYDSSRACKHQTIGREPTPIPTYAVLRIFPSNSMVTMRMAGLRRKRQSGCPIMGNLHNLPCTVFLKLQRIRPLIVDAVAFRQKIEIFRTATKVANRISCMAEMKMPVVGEIDTRRSYRQERAATEYNE